ncbi:MAG: DUF4350 domain-containing protein [Candidatus Eremiobacteraeota bacterium]|nr:DUF4350 domain-containing protein [Candidatus Eremiobacteraeota bacterium]MBV8366068.1 DUF4350 domain-containing protein [Candidatus Eremiobacteraeota bacterium]
MRRSFPWTEIIVLALAAGVVLAITYAAYRHQQATAPHFATFSSYDAHSGGYRAWYELLQREGFHVVRFGQRPAFLDASIGTLIASPNEKEVALRAQQTQDVTGVPQDIDFENLRAWVHDGGRLVWVTDGSWDDPLDLDTDSAGPKDDNAIPVALSPQTDGVSSVVGVDSLRVRPGTSPLYVPLLADSAGAVVAERRYGKGTILVVTDQSLFDNKHIALGDNAKLAYGLAAGTSGTVAFDEYLHGYVSGSSWWTILPAPVRAALIIAVAGFTLLLVGTALRFGPTARLPENTERTSAEYLSSMAQLLARGRAARKALRDLAGVTLRDVASSLGLSDRATAAQIAASARNGENGETRAAQIEELGRLQMRNEPANVDLLRAAQLSASLRKEYSRYGRIGFGRRAAPIGRTA